MFKRQTSGPISCPSCRQLVDVKAPRCPHCDRKNPGMWGYARTLQRFGADLGFIEIVTWGCLTVYVLTLLADVNGVTAWGGGGAGTSLLAPSGGATFLFGATGAVPIFTFNRWWTVLTGPWLHGDLLHIGFNIAIFRYFAPIVARIYGASRLAIIYIIAGICGCLLTSVVRNFTLGMPEFLQGASFAVGASGAILGLLGALVAYAQQENDSSVLQTAGIYALFIIIFGFLFPRTDNLGHLGGFLGGYLATKLPSLNSRDRSGQNHLFIAIALLFATFLSLIVSVIHALFIN
ncbi:MAG: rhomboid family intramembrane serine protease [Cyanobacteriota bacterium]|nr:rhomboid family intramembrane serine protease [Cyanobacteriota bacterium]